MRRRPRPEGSRSPPTCVNAHRRYSWLMLPHDELGTGPAVVLLHAGVADRTMWADHLKPLAEAGYRAVAPELPGLGEVPLPQGEYAPWVDVLRTMDELAIERAALVGNSFGADVALRAALVAPDRVSALVLCSARAPGVGPFSELEAAWEAEIAALDRGDVEAAVDAVVDAWTLPDAPNWLRERVAAISGAPTSCKARRPRSMRRPTPSRRIRPASLGSTCPPLPRSASATSANSAKGPRCSLGRCPVDATPSSTARGTLRRSRPRWPFASWSWASCASDEFRAARGLMHDSRNRTKETPDGRLRRWIRHAAAEVERRQVPRDRDHSGRALDRARRARLQGVPGRGRQGGRGDLVSAQRQARGRRDGDLRLDHLRVARSTGTRSTRR